MLEKLYDWIGIASIILEHANGKKHVVVVDAYCGTGKRLAYLKQLLAQHELNIYTVGMIPYGSTYENLTKNNLDEIIYPSQNIGADYVIALDIPKMDINAQLPAKRGGMLICSDNTSLHIPKILSSEKNPLIQVAQKYHKIAREIDGNELDECIEIPKYESVGILDSIIQHSKDIKRSDLIIVDAGCGSGHAALELKTQLDKNNITTTMIGIDEFQSHYENCLDDFVQANIEDMKTILPTADVVISVGSGSLLPIKRVNFIKNCDNMLRQDGLYIENNGVFAGIVYVKKKEIKKYISITKSAKIHETPYISEVNSIYEFAFMELNPTTKHIYKNRLEKYKIDPYMFAMTFLRWNQPQDWKADNYKGLKLETLFKQYIKDGRILLHDDLFEINL